MKKKNRTIKFKPVTADAKAPVRSTPGSAGFDIFANEHATLKPGIHAVLNTGISCALPDGTVGLIWPRSGMAAKYGVDTLAGVVDSDYRGEVRVSLINHGQHDVEIRPGDRIAQMIVQHFLGLAEVTAELDDTERGVNGFGSTGH